MPSNDKAVLAVLNSNLVWHFQKSVCVVRSGGYIEVKPQYFEQIPVPAIEGSIKLKLIELAETAIREKCNNQQADISRIENQIDQLVYQLYGLTEAEIDVIEN